MVKHTTLHSQTAEICRSHSPEMGVITVTLNYDVPAIGKPTAESPDMYSLVNTTEKAVDIQVVDENLPMSQRIIDSRPTSIDPRDANTPLRDEVRNNDEPRYWSETNLQDIGLDFDADEELSSEASVENQFNKMEFLNVFQKAINNMITHMTMKVAEEPPSPKHNKQLCEKKAIPPPPPKTNDTNSVARQNSIDPNQTIETDNLICQFVRSDSGSTDHV